MPRDVRRERHANRRPSRSTQAVVAYFKLLRMAAQACGTPESTALLPGMTAQPPFSTICRLFIRASLLQRRQVVRGVRAMLELIDTDRRYRRDHGAIGGAVRPNVFAVLPSIHPPQPKPTARVATAPTVAPCRSRFRDSPWYQADVGTRLSPQFGEEGFLPSEHGATNHEWGRITLARLRFVGRSIVHSAHAAAARHCWGSILLRRLGHHDLGRNHEAGDRSRVL